VGGGAAVVVAGWLAPILIGLSLLLLARSFYVLYVLRRGSRVSTVVTWLAAVFVIGFWTWKLI